jgi:hypothetical protein
MGDLLKFPNAWRFAQVGPSGRKKDEPATVIILPVVRVERQDGAPSSDLTSGTGSGKRRRPRGSRS